MASGDPHQYLIAYDIADPLRLGRLHRHVKMNAIPVQYSVFTAWLDRAQVETLAEEIEAIIDSAEDDVRIYPLTRAPTVKILGNCRIPEGISLVTKDKVITLGTIVTAGENGMKAE